MHTRGARRGRRATPCRVVGEDIEKNGKGLLLPQRIERDDLRAARFFGRDVILCPPAFSPVHLLYKRKRFPYTYRRGTAHRWCSVARALSYRTADGPFSSMTDAAGASVGAADARARARPPRIVTLCMPNVSPPWANVFLLLLLRLCEFDAAPGRVARTVRTGMHRAVSRATRNRHWLSHWGGCSVSCTLGGQCR
jgi:hypothetical protein